MEKNVEAWGFEPHIPDTQLASVITPPLDGLRRYPQFKGHAHHESSCITLNSNYCTSDSHEQYDATCCERRIRTSDL